MLHAPFRHRGETGTAERLLIGAGERNYEIAVIRHPRARRYTLRVRHASRDVVLTMPRRGSLRDARAFAEKNVHWIASKIAAIPDNVPFADGETIPLRGVPHRICHRSGERGTVWIENDETGDPLICVAGANAHLARRVKDFLKGEARKALSAASRIYAAKIGVTIGRIGLRDSTTRWGSCSESGSLSYSWRLIFAPAYVLDYLAAHEIAHRIELNHSDRFWALLDSMTPERRRAEAWLSANGNALHRYGGSS
jgi:predicted metal-dependent hydrolase